MEKKRFEEEMLEKSKILGVRFSVEQIEQFYKYMNLLIEWNEKMNLTAITDESEIISKHFVDSLTILKYIKNNDKVIKKLEIKAKNRVNTLMNKTIDKLYVKEKADVLKYAEKFYSKKYKETKKLGYKNKDILNKISFKFNTNVQIKSTELSIKSVRKENSYE